jgi:thiosulfate reductase cytochrome b subunit
MLLLLTGFEVHGSISLLGFERAVTVHNFLGLTWLIAFAFFVFWVFTTGEWKQYVPTTKMMFEVMAYYGYGIFAGQPHPCPKRPDAKHNPLQRMTYLSLAAVLLPFQMVTGLLYYLYNSWAEMGITGLSLEVVAVAHLIGAFAILLFLIVHVYMTTTGHTLFGTSRPCSPAWKRSSTPRRWRTGRRRPRPEDIPRARARPGNVSSMTRPRSRGRVMPLKPAVRIECDAPRRFRHRPGPVLEKE